MTEAAPLPLEVRDLTFRYQSRQSAAIEQINLALRPGEVMLLAGANTPARLQKSRYFNLPSSRGSCFSPSLTKPGVLSSRH